MIPLTREEAVKMLHCVAECEGINQADIKFISRYGEELISVQPNCPEFKGRLEFDWSHKDHAQPHRRIAAWKASLFLSKLGDCKRKGITAYSSNGKANHA